MGIMGKQGKAHGEHPEHRRVMEAFRDEVVAHPLLSLGFSLFWAWVWLAFQSPFFSMGFTSSPLKNFPTWVVPLFAYAATFFVMGILFKQKNIMPRTKNYIRALSAIMVFGTLLCAVVANLPTDSSALNVVLYCLGGVVIGAGTACIHFEWGRVLGYLGPRKTIIHGVVGTLGAACLLVFFNYVPQSLLWICALVIPTLSLALLSYQRRSLPKLYGHGLEAKLNIPWRFLVTSFIQGISFGIMQTILLLSGANSVSILNASGFLVAAMLLLVAALFYKLDFNQLIYQVGFTCIAAGFTLLALFGSPFIGGWLFHTIGYRFVDIMMWTLCTYLVKQRGLPTNWVFALTTCSLLLGQVTGALVGHLALNIELFGPDGVNTLSVFMIFVVLTSALIMFNKKNIRAGWGMVRPGDSEQSESVFEMSCDLVCDGYNLTTREKEVFIILAKGRDRMFIGQELTLSRETVKTHIRNIYRKMDIHSQQEILSLIENQMQIFDPENERESSPLSL